MYRKKNIVIITMCVAILLMIIGYAAFSTSLKINGTGKITSVWDIYFESVTLSSTVGTASEASNPTISNTSISFNINLRKPGDKVVYKAVLKNAGTVDAKVSEINAEAKGTAAIINTVTGIKQGDTVSAGSSKTITITVEYDKTITTVPSITTNELTINIECIQPDQSITSEDLVVYQPMLKPAIYYSGTDQTFFEGPILEKDIESITFTNTKTVPSGVIGSWDVSTAGDGKVIAWYTDSDFDSLYEVTIGQDGGVIANPNSSYLFHYLINVETIDLTYFDTSLVTDMYAMFSHCQKLTSLDVSNFDTGKVTFMQQMFKDCPALTELDLNGFDTEKVTNMSQMFNGCKKLIDLRLDNFDTSKVINMSYMFAYCNSLTELNLNNFDTSKVTNMGAMFTHCWSLTNLDLSNFNTSKVTNMNHMFYNCSKLLTLNIQNATFDSVTTYTDMFIYTYSPMTIIVKSTTEQAWILDRKSTANVVIG